MKVLNRNHTFPGSRIIRIEQTTSTNWELLQLSGREHLPEGSVLVTDTQTKGRGQGENSWESEPYKNLTFSILLYPEIKASGQFVLSKVISLAVRDFLAEKTDHVSVKWPNDVYVGDKKITGILIENFIEGGYITKTITGIGININQQVFTGDAPNPVSLNQITGNTYDLEECLKKVVQSIAGRYNMVKNRKRKTLDSDYLKYMYRYGILSRFSENGKTSDATITGVNKYGMLEITLPDHTVRTFGFKEITLVL